eukprot:SAG11_NODE_5059_length_1677_cov_1.162864_2_plen_217_part_00
MCCVESKLQPSIASKGVDLTRRRSALIQWADALPAVTSPHRKKWEVHEDHPTHTYLAPLVDHERVPCRIGAACGCSNDASHAARRARSARCTLTKLPEPVACLGRRPCPERAGLVHPDTVCRRAAWWAALSRHSVRSFSRPISQQRCRPLPTGRYLSSASPNGASAWPRSWRRCHARPLGCGCGRGGGKCIDIGSQQVRAHRLLPIRIHFDAPCEA